MAFEPSEPDQDPLERPTDEIEFHGRPVLGVLIMVMSLVALFGFGFLFDLFGKPLRFNAPGPYLFYGAIWLGVFGLARSFVSGLMAFRMTVIVAGLFLLIFFAGKLSRGEI